VKVKVQDMGEKDKRTSWWCGRDGRISDCYVVLLCMH